MGLAAFPLFGQEAARLQAVVTASALDTSKAAQAAHSPTAQAAIGQQVVTGYQFGPFSFGADSPLGQFFGGASNISDAFGNYNAAFAKANPGASALDTITHEALGIGGLAGNTIGDIGAVGGSLLGATGQAAGQGIGTGVGAAVQGVGTGVGQGAMAAGPGVGTGVGAGLAGIGSGIGSAAPAVITGAGVGLGAAVNGIVGGLTGGGGGLGLTGYLAIGGGLVVLVLLFMLIK